MVETPLGTRTLVGHESRLFRAGIAILVDAIRAEMELDVEIQLGVPIFESLTSYQKLYYLCRVSRAMLMAEVDPLPKSAPHEATIAAVYRQLIDCVEQELDIQQEEQVPTDVSSFYREIAAKAIEEVRPNERWPDPECVLFEEWEIVIEALQMCVLPDEDWRMESPITDIDPDESEALMQIMGIDADYFMAIPPDDDRLNPKQDIDELVRLARREFD